MVNIRRNILDELLFVFFVGFVGGSRRLNHRARASIAIPDIPDEIFYKVSCHVRTKKKRNDDDVLFCSLGVMLYQTRG